MNPTRGGSHSWMVHWVGCWEYRAQVRHRCICFDFNTRGINPLLWLKQKFKCLFLALMTLNDEVKKNIVLRLMNTSRWIYLKGTPEHQTTLRLLQGSKVTSEECNRQHNCRLTSTTQISLINTCTRLEEESRRIFAMHQYFVTALLHFQTQ